APPARPTSWASWSSRASASTATSGSRSRPRSASSVSRGLLSPRGGAAPADLGERTPLVAGQRTGPARRRRRARALARLTRRAAVCVLVLGGVAAALAGARWVTTAPRFADAGGDGLRASLVPRPRTLPAAAPPPGARLR